MATTSARSVFLDTNVLLRANVAEAPSHNEVLSAIKRLRSIGDELWISRQVLREFMAILTRPQSFADPRPVATIIERVHYFQAHFRVADEDEAVTTNLVLLLQAIPMGGKQIHDANIVATMQVHSIKHLFTINTVDFSRYSSFITLLSVEQIMSQI